MPIVTKKFTSLNAAWFPVSCGESMIRTRIWNGAKTSRTGIEQRQTPFSKLSYEGVCAQL